MLRLEPPRLTAAPTSRIMEPPSHMEKGQELLGSDGETSDYQRSTPSPRDTDARITDLGLEKCEDVVSECWKAGGGGGSNPPPATPSLSPDLGFVDCGDVAAAAFKSAAAASAAYKSACDKKLPFVCLPSLKAETLKPTAAEVRLSAAAKPAAAEGSHRLPPVLHDGPRRYAYPRPSSSDNNRRFSPIVSPAAAAAKSAKNTLLKTHKNLSVVGKKVTVEIEKLPNKMTSSLVETATTAVVNDNDIFLMNSVSSSTSSRQSVVAKGRFDIVRTAKEISLKNGGLVALSTYRSPKSSQPSAPSPSTTSISFTPRTFYSSTTASNKLIKPESVVSKISPSKTESCESLCSSSGADASSSILSSQASGSQDSISEPTSSAAGSEIGEEPAAGSEIGEEPAAGSEIGEEPVRPFRFPTLAGNTSAIPCKWHECGQGFKSHAKLSDHIKTVHMAPQLESVGVSPRDYTCLWVGCKVYGARSSSSSWLTKHVPLHGGKLTFTCIVDACKMRFSSQVMLQRHVNSHFSETPSGSNQVKSAARKSIETAPARKVLKRAGVKLKFRKLPFSARIFDFFDAGMMAGIRDQVSRVQGLAANLSIVDDAMVFKARAMALREAPDGTREVQLKWIPKDIIPDEWVPLDAAKPTKSVKLCQLPEAAKVKLQQQLLLRPPAAAAGTKQQRKRKFVAPPSPFLTPEEVEEEEERRRTKKLPHPAAHLFL